MYAVLLADGTKLLPSITKEAEAAGSAAGQTMSSRIASTLKSNIGPAAGAVLGAAFVGAAGGAGRLVDQMRTVNTVAKLTDAALGDLQKQVLDLSKETGKGTDELTAGLYDLVSAGVPADKAIGVLRASAILATGALGTTAETVDLITSAMNAYGLTTEDATRITDIFAQAVADGKVTAAELGTTIANIAPLAASAGVSLEEVAAGYALLTAKGVPAAQAATQMRAAISALLTPNTQLNAIQKQTGKNFAELAKAKGLAVALDELRRATGGNDEAFAKALGSVEAYQFALASTGDNAGDFATELGKITKGADEGGVALSQYEERMKGPTLRAKQLVNSLRVTALEAAGPFADSIGVAAIALNELGAGMTGLANLSRVFGGVIGAGLTKAFTTFGPLIKGKVVGAIMALIVPSSAAAGIVGEATSTAMAAGMSGPAALARFGAIGRIAAATIGAALLAAPLAIPVALNIAFGEDFSRDAVARKIENFRRKQRGLGPLPEEAAKDGAAAADAYATAYHEELHADDAREASRGLEMTAAVLRAKEAGEKAGTASGNGYFRAFSLAMHAGFAGSTAGPGSITAALVGMHLPAVRTAKQSGRDAVRGFITAITGRRAEVDSAWSNLLQVIKDNKGREDAKVLGRLISKQLAHALKSGDPLIRGTAQETRRLFLERLGEIVPANGKLGKKAQDELNKALKSKDPEVRARAREVKHLIEENLLPDTKKVGNATGDAVVDSLMSAAGPIGTAAYELGRRIITGNIVAGVKGGKPVTVSHNGPGSGGQGFGGRIRDSGGPVRSGEPYVIGVNREPEIFIPERNGRIATFPQLAAAAAGGGGDTHHHLHVTGDIRARDPAEALHQMQRLRSIAYRPFSNAGGGPR